MIYSREFPRSLPSLLRALCRLKLPVFCNLIQRKTKIRFKWVGRKERKKSGMKNYVELSSELNCEFHKFHEFPLGIVEVEYTHLTCHFRTAAAFRADAGNHGGYFRLSAKRKIKFCC